MLMQIFAITSFAETKELTWVSEPFKGKIIGANYGFDYSLENFVFYDDETKKHGIMDRSGNVIVNAQLEFKGILYFYGDQYMQVYKNKEDGYGRMDAIFNSKGEIVIDFGVYDRMEKISDDIIIAKKGDLYGIVSPTGKVRTDFIYSEISWLIQNQYMYDDINYVCAKKDGKYGVIDADGKVIIPFEHDDTIYSFDKGYMVGRLGSAAEKTYYLDLNGKKVDISQIKIERKENTFVDDYYIQFETDKYYCIFKDGKYGLADKNMNILIPVQYYGLYQSGVSDEIFRVKESENTLDTGIYVDKKGNPIDYLNNYSELRSTKSDYIIGKDKENENYGMIDKTGNILIPFEYSFINEITDDMFVIETYSKKTGIAEFGTGKKIKDTFEGLILKIDDKTATAFNEDVEMDVAPIIRNGRTMLPARFVAENLGAEVSWDGASQTVTISKGAYPLKITIGSSEVKIGPYTSKIDSPAFIENGRTYVPVRLIAENLGADVFWEQDTQTVKILKK